ncbi:hypothetical protein BC332_29050 [Capsicum chinense]|nr:hypothetical protein BC332_29050 [Capsicum chinense]
MVIVLSSPFFSTLGNEENNMTVLFYRDDDSASDTLESFNLKEQNAKGTEGSLEEIESTVNEIVPFVLQSGDEESREPYIGGHVHVLNMMGCEFDMIWTSTQSEKHYTYAYQRLLQLCKELDELPYEDENDNVCDSQVNESNLNLNSSEQRQDIGLLDPPCVATKGRPNSLRRKGGLESS